jgi:hypothetical protein
VDLILIMDSMLSFLGMVGGILLEILINDGTLLQLEIVETILLKMVKQGD